MTSAVATAEALTLTTSDGFRLDAWRWRTEGTPRASVVLVHGFVGRGNSVKLADHAEALCVRGFDVIVYDARGHGASEGSCTLGDLERHDVEAAAAAVSDRAEDVVLVGESMGGIAVLRTAAETDVPVVGVVTVGSPALWRLQPNLRTLGAALLTRTDLGRRLAQQHLGVRIGPEWTRPTAPAELAARLDVPYVVLHGEEDRFMPEREAVELHTSAGGPVRLEFVPGMGHGFVEAASVAPVCRAVEWVVSAA